MRVVVVVVGSGIGLFIYYSGRRLIVVESPERIVSDDDELVRRQKEPHCPTGAAATITTLLSGLNCAIPLFIWTREEEFRRLQLWWTGGGVCRVSRSRLAQKHLANNLLLSRQLLRSIVWGAVGGSAVGSLLSSALEESKESKESKQT